MPPMMQDPLQLQANFQPYPRLNQVQSDPMYPIVGSPVTPQPPPLQPMWVQAPIMQQQVPLETERETFYILPEHGTIM